MELSFVIAALRRRWWLVLLFSQLALWPYVLLAGSETEYESVGLLEIREPASTQNFSSTPDRYLLSQLEVLRSESMAAAVTDVLGGEPGPSAVQLATTFAHLPETDVVSVEVIWSNADGAYDIAQAYMGAYIEKLSEEEAAALQPRIDEFNTRLETSEARLLELNDQMQDAMRTYIRPSEPGAPIPDASLVVPHVVVERDLLVAEIARIELQRAEILNRGTEIQSRILQDASRPVEPLPSSSNLIQMVLLVGGALMGAAVAIVWARFSTRVLDDPAANAILGTPIVANSSRHRDLRTNPVAALSNLPQEHVIRIDQLCVRAEALAPVDQPLVIAVVGTQRGAGATTLAMSMAARMAAAEYSVLLIDGDRRDPWISGAFRTERSGGIQALTNLTDDGVDQVFTSTQEPYVRVLGFGRATDALRRELVPKVIDGARQAAEIIIVDGGPLLDSASTVEFCFSADVVVLAVPLQDQRSDELAAVSRQLSTVIDRVLPVHTSPISTPADLTGERLATGFNSLGMNGEIIPMLRDRVEQLRRQQEEAERYTEHQLIESDVVVGDDELTWSDDLRSDTSDSGGGRHRVEAVDLSAPQGSGPRTEPRERGGVRSEERSRDRGADSSSGASGAPRQAPTKPRPRHREDPTGLPEKRSRATKLNGNRDGEPGYDRDDT